MMDDKNCGSAEADRDDLSELSDRLHCGQDGWMRSARDDDFEEYVSDFDNDDRYDPDDSCTEIMSMSETQEDPYCESGIRAERDFYTNSEIDECLGGYFRFFGKKDMDMIYLYFLSDKKQDDLMSILGKSQPAVSYDVGRIRIQAKFVKTLMASLDEVIAFILDSATPLRTFDKELLLVFFYSTSISKTARLMGMSSVTCRSHLNTLIRRISAMNRNVHQVFRYVLSNLNKVKKIVFSEDELDKI